MNQDDAMAQVRVMLDQAEAELDPVPPIRFLWESNPWLRAVFDPGAEAPDVVARRQRIVLGQDEADDRKIPDKRAYEDELQAKAAEAGKRRKKARAASPR